MTTRLLAIAACLSLMGPAACNKEQNRSGSGKRASHMVGRRAGGGEFDGLYVETRPFMGTIFRMIVAINPQAPDQKAERNRAASAVRAAFRAVADIEAAMSDHIPGSQVSLLNSRAARALSSGRPVTAFLDVSPDVMAVFQEALQASRLTSGAFDVSYAALKGPWGMKGDGPHRLPTQEEINKALPFVGYQGIHLDPQNNRIQLKAGMRIDLGGVAKGYALDIASKVLKNAGFPNHIIYGGGDLNVSGRRPDRPWRVGIQDPGKRGDYFAVLSLSNMAVVTSGDYERYFMKNGRRYAHIIDPRTGRPARGLHSVTVVADRAVYADAMATGLFVLGLARAKRLVERIPGTEAIFVTQQGKVVITSGLAGKVEILHPPTIAGHRAMSGAHGKASPGRKVHRKSPTRPQPRAVTPGRNGQISPRREGRPIAGSRTSTRRSGPSHAPRGEARPPQRSSGAARPRPAARARPRHR